MYSQTEKRAETKSRRLLGWLTLVGVILLIASPIIGPLSDNHLAKFGGTCALVGSTLYLLPESLDLRLWPFLGLYVAIGIVGLVLAPTELGLICILIALGFFFLLCGIVWWKLRRAKSV